MKLLLKDKAQYIENKYVYLTGLEGHYGKIKAVVTTSNDLDESLYKVVVVLFTDDPLNDKFIDLDEFCRNEGIEYNED